MGKHRAPRSTLPFAAALAEAAGGVASAAARVGGAVTALPAPALGGAALGALGAASAVLAPPALAAGDHGGPAASPRRDAAIVAVPAGARFAPPTAGELAALRACEAGGNYGIATGNGFYGAYQFDLGTWRGLGLGGYPHQGSPALQDAAASALEQARGWGPWPACSQHLGLVPRSASTPPAVVVEATTSVRESPGFVAGAFSAGRHRRPLGSGPTVVEQAASPRVAAAAPAFAGHVLSVVDAGRYRSDVRLWQERMAQRGWSIAADGHFGPRTQAVAKAFAAEKGVHDALPGEVGRRVWAAAWRMPVAG